MDTIRYYLALIVVVTIPPGLLTWFFVHPFARFWRRRGPLATYAALSVPAIAMMTLVFLARGRLLAVDLGTSYPLIALSALVLAVAVPIGRQRKRYLRTRIMTGLAEISSGPPGKLLTEGIYARIRHPRYVEVFLWLLAEALFTNYLAMHVVAALSVPVLLLIILLEERELRDRFGREYEDYCRRVPRFLPSRKPAPREGERDDADGVSG